MYTLENKQHTQLPRYIRVRSHSGEQSAIVPGTSLYIGHNTDCYNKLKQAYSSLLHAETLEQGIRVLADVDRTSGDTSSIFLDLPLNYEEYYVFSTKKEALAGLREVPVLMNVRQLNKEQISLVRRKKLVDELIDFKIDLDFIEEKIDILHFIRKGIHSRGSRIKLEHKRSSVQTDLNPVKRIINLFFSLSLIIFALPVMAFVALAVKLDSHGPVMFNSYNAGRGYHIFKLFQFRTMKVGADRLAGSMIHLNAFNNFGNHPSIMNSIQDPRLTRVGRVLVWSGLDKLPSLFNVLLGDIALVGNKPLSLIEASTQTSRNAVDYFLKPVGMTGFLKEIPAKHVKQDTMKARTAAPFGYVTLAMDKAAGFSSPMHEGSI